MAIMEIDKEKNIKSIILQLGKDVWQSFQADNVPLVAAGVAFYLILSMIPLLLLIISIAAYFITANQISAISQEMIKSFGAGIGTAIETQIFSVVHNRGVLTGISLFVGLWAGSQIFVIIETALNKIWDVTETRPFWVTRGLALAMVAVTGILLLVAVVMTYIIRILAGINIPVLSSYIQRIPGIMTLLFDFVLPCIMIILAFLFIYRFLSAYKVTWGMALPGAAIAGLLCTLMLQVFSWYSSAFSDYNTLYGSLGGLVLLMLWFHYSAMILLLGAEITRIVHQYRSSADVTHPG